jgi:hypothetical protein
MESCRAEHQNRFQAAKRETADKALVICPRSLSVKTYKAQYIINLKEIY